MDVRKARRRLTPKMIAVGIVLPLAVLFGTVGASAATKHATDHVKQYPGVINISYPTAQATEFLPLTLAKANGIFAKYGLNVNVTVVPSASIDAALLSGALQFSVDAGPLVDLGYISGIPVQMIANWGNHTTGEFIARPGFPTIKSLIGHTIGASGPTALSTILPEYALHLAGVPLSEVTFVPSGTNAYGAFIAGLFDADDASVGNANEAIAALPGTTVLYNFAKLPWPCCEVWGNIAWMKANKGATVAMLKALNDAVVTWNANPSLADAQISSVQGLLTQSSISAAYVSTKIDFNHGSVPVKVPTVHLQSEVMKILRLTGFPKSYNSYADKGKEWTPVYWDAAFGSSS